MNHFYFIFVHALFAWSFFFISLFNYFHCQLIAAIKSFLSSVWNRTRPRIEELENGHFQSILDPTSKDYRKDMPWSESDNSFIKHTTKIHRGGIFSTIHNVCDMTLGAVVGHCWRQRSTLMTFWRRRHHEVSLMFSAIVVCPKMLAISFVPILVLRDCAFYKATFNFVSQMKTWNLRLNSIGNFILELS
jgi:hypothetical protein